MTSQIDLNTAASVAAVAGALGGAWRITHALAKWKEATDDHLKKQDDHLTRQDGRMDTIEKELKPNGGGSHHDVIVKEIRSAFAEVERERERERRRRRWLF